MAGGQRLRSARVRSGVIFSDLMLVQTAAISGQGIMMGDEITCAGALAAGQLVAAVLDQGQGARRLLPAAQPAAAAESAMLAFTRWLNALLMRIGIRGGRFCKSGRGPTRRQCLAAGTGANTSNLRSMIEPDSWYGTQVVWLTRLRVANIFNT